MSERPPYVTARRRKNGDTAWYWLVPKGRRMGVRVRSMALGTDQEGAFAVARALLIGETVVPRPDRRTALARRFADLDAVSRTRSLTDAESDELEQVMSDLGILTP